jgi:hypothetical protein
MALAPLSFCAFAARPVAPTLHLLLSHLKENLVMVHKAKPPVRIAASIVVAAVMLMTAFSAGLSSPTARSPWPKNKGLYLAASSETIPVFPRALSGFRSENNKDFWDHTFTCRGSIRVFEGKGWTGVPDFPATMNGCSHGVFMIRWRSSLPIESALGFHELTVSSGPKRGAFGYMYGTNCDQPMFKFVSTAGNRSTLTDVFYELKFWQAAP